MTIPTDPALLTDTEHTALNLSGLLARQLETIAGNDPDTRDNDIRKLQDMLHHIQAHIMAQAAARAYPNLYRLLGGPIVNPGVTRTHNTTQRPTTGTPITNPNIGDQVRLSPKYGILSTVDGTIILFDTNHAAGVLLDDYGTLFVPLTDLTKTPNPTTDQD